MLKKIVIGVALLGLVIAVSPTASASCNPGKSARTYLDPTHYVYWSIPDTGNGDMLAQSWQLGAYATYNDRSNGVAPACTFNSLYPSGSNQLGLYIQTGGCGTGCPLAGATLAVMAETRGAGETDFLIATQAENNQGVTWQYFNQGAKTLIKLPHPRVNSSARAANLVNLQLSVDATSAACSGTGTCPITGYKILGLQNATDPGRSAGAYTNTVATLTTTAGGPAGPIAGSVDCTDGTRSWWLVTQVIVEGGAVGSDAVSGATRVSCGPGNLADPKFKIVDKKAPTKNAPSKH